MITNSLPDQIKRLIALAETGIFYARNEFDLQRYTEMLELSVETLGLMSGSDPLEISPWVIERNGYKTPKVDIRAVIFNEKSEILLVKEKIDGKWALPGGWAEIGFTPAEVAVKESREEAGAIVSPVRLLAILDKKKHPHPSDLYYIYKVFIQCELQGWSHPDQMETSDAGFFDKNHLPELSLPRNTPDQINRMYELKNDPTLNPIFD